MAIARLSKVQDQFVENVTRAEAAGVTYQTGIEVRAMLLAGHSYCRFGNGQVASLTDDYLMDCDDYLYAKAHEEGKGDEIDWVGIES